MSNRAVGLLNLILWDVTGSGLEKSVSETMGPYRACMWAQEKKESRRQRLGDHQCFRVKQRKGSPTKDRKC